MNMYQKIGDYLEFLTRQYGLQICIKDFYGFIPINKKLDAILQPYLAHTNPFCMYMKSTTASYHVCLTMIRKMYEKLETTPLEYFYGTCHAGLGEYVIPIRSQKLLLGTINAGFFQRDPSLEESKLVHACSKSAHLTFETAKQLYDSSIQTVKINPDELLPQLFLLAEYLGHTYEVLETLHPEIAAAYHYHSSNEDTILSHAFEYIRQNCLQHISAKELAAFCHCSTSYLSHIFKKRTNMNLNTYINKLRIERSKKYLEHSGGSIAEIATSCGFDDPNYFSRVFSQIIGISPKEYRRRFRKANDQNGPQDA